MKQLAAALLLSLAGCAGGGERPFTATKYRPAGLLGGYSEKQVEPGVWRVTGRANGPAGPGFGRDMAVYRAAELMAGQGHRYMQVIDQKGSSRMIGFGSPTSFAGEELTLTVRGSGSASPGECRAKRPEACMTLDTAAELARLRSRMGVTP